MTDSGRHPSVASVVIVDDSEEIRSAVRSIVEGAHHRVTGEASCGHDGIVVCRDLRPDIVLLDISLPDFSGFVVAEAILRFSPQTRVIFISAHSSRMYIEESVRRGHLFIRKGDAATELTGAIAAALKQDTVSPMADSSVGHGVAAVTLEVHKPAFPAVPPRPQQNGVDATIPSPCLEARQLLAEFARCVTAVLTLVSEQFDAVLSGDVDANRFDLLIHEANEQKQDAKYAYLEHRQKHGCGNNNGA